MGDRRALQSVAVQFFVNGTVVGSILPRLPEIRDRIGVDLDTLGLVLTLASLGGLVGALAASTVVDRIGTRGAMAVGGTVLVASLPAVAFSTGPWMLWAALAVMLLADVVADVGMNMQGSAISARRHTPVMNRLHGLWSFGTVLGGIIASVLAGADVPLTVHLPAMAGVLLVALLYVVPGLLPEAEVTFDQDTDTADASTANTAADARTAKGAARRVVLGLGLLGFLAMIPELAAGDWSALRLSDDLDASPGVAALAYVAFTCGMVLGRFAGDSILGVIGDQRLVRNGALVAVAGFALAFGVDTVPTTLIGLVVVGCGISVLFPTLYDEAAKAKGGGAAGLGAMTFGARIGALGTPVAVGSLAATDLGVGQAVLIVCVPMLLILAAIRTSRAGRSVTG